MTGKTDVYVIIGVLLSLVTLILYLKNQDGGSGPTVEPVFQVTAPDATVAALHSNETLARIGANKDITLAWLQYSLGIKQADTALAVENVDATRDVTLGGQTAAAQIQTAQLAQTVALEQAHVADRASSRQAWSSAFTGIFKTIGSIFGI